MVDITHLSRGRITMAEADSSSAATPSATRCGRCQAALSDSERVSAQDRFFCRTCYEILKLQLRTTVATMSENVNYPMALLGAVLGGVAGALVWWGFTVLTKIGLGLIAVGIGFLVGHGAARGAGGRAREVENLRAVYQSLQQPQAPVEARSGQAKKVAAGAAGAGLLFVLGKAKFLGLLAGVLKFKTLATMLLSIGAYAIEWGWLFAIGFVLLIFVHEMGHAVAMRIEGIPAGPPVFIPFVGAFVAMQGQPRDAAVEARVAMAGPVVGSLAAWAVLGAGLELEQRLLVALGHTGILLNLFNLVPVPPLDGGRIAGAFTRTYWLIGYAVGIAALLVTGSPILLLVLVIGLFMLVRRWRDPMPGYA